jgi:hypothetical protein
MVRQWNSLSLDCETTRSTISRSALAWSQRVMLSPSSSRSFAFVAEKTLTPVNRIARSSLTPHPPPARASLGVILA